MLNDPIIYKNASLSDSENYVFLRQKGLEYVEQLASGRWTDYNSHDPGITILEALCYAITDLGYRTQYEIKDLLTRSDQGSSFTVGRFHSAAQILSCYPITFDDLRKVLIDIRGVRNAWIYPINTAAYRVTDCQFEGLLPEELSHAKKPATGEDAAAPDAMYLNGLFEVCLEYEEFLKDLRLGPADLSCLRPGQGRYLQPQGQGIVIDIGQDVVLQAVSVYAADPDEVEDVDGNLLPGSPVPIRVELRRASGELLRTWDLLIKDPHTKTRLELDHLFVYEPDTCDADPEANTYLLSAEGPEGCLWLFAHHEGLFHFSLQDDVSLRGGNPDPETYYFFYDWEWDSAASEDTLGKWAKGRIGEPDDTRFLSEYVVPSNQSLVFDAEQDFLLEAVHVFASKPGKLRIELIHGENEVLYCHETHLSAKLCKLRIPLCWKIPSCQHYRLVATTEKGMALTLSRGAAFPYAINGVLQLLGGEVEGRLTQVYPYFYDWEITWRSPLLGEIEDHALTKGRVKREVWRRLHAQRSLCEDPIKVSEISTEEVGIQAQISLAPAADANLVLAEILWLLEIHVKPPIHFYSLSQMVERGYSMEEIFQGPILEHGFVDSKEFAQAIDRKDLRSSDVINLLMDVAGVKHVKSLLLQSYRNGVLYQEHPWLICLHERQCTKPNFSPTRSCFQFLKNGLPVQVDQREVYALLEEKRLERQPRKQVQATADLPIPVGEDMEVKNYWPAQHDLPGIYHTGRYQPRDSDTALRKAQSLQLKSFLMFFEQLLANYLAQLDQMHHLFSWEPLPAARTYFTQLATEGILEQEDLYLEYQSLTTELERIIEVPEAALERRARFLDHLLARFSESMSDYSVLMYQLLDGKETSLSQVIRDKELLLAHYPRLSRERARAFDYRAAELLPSGYQLRVMALLGMRPKAAPSWTMPPDATFQHHAEAGWRFVVELPPGTPLFYSRYGATQAEAVGLFDLLLMQGREASSFVARERQEEGCNTSIWELHGPCEGPEHPALGWIPDGNETTRDALIDWVKAHEAASSPPEQLATHWVDIASDHFDTIQEEDGWRFVVTDGEKVLFRSASCHRQAEASQLLDAALHIGYRRDHYRFQAESCQWELVKDCEDGSSPAVFGNTTQLEFLSHVIALFELASKAEGFHVMEHILLRPRVAGDAILQALPGYPEEQHPPIEERYSFQCTVLLPAWTARNERLSFRRLTEDTLRREAPAHLYLHVIWVEHTQMRRFEEAYHVWLEALAALPASYTGLSPLPDASAVTEVYQASLKQLIRNVECLRSVYPPARLYDPAAPRGGEAPTLGNMSLRAM